MALVSQSYCVQTSGKARPRSPFPWLNCIQLIHILRAWEALRAASIQMPVFCVRALSAVLNSLLPSSLFSLFFLVARAYRRALRLLHLNKDTHMIERPLSSFLFASPFCCYYEIHPLVRDAGELSRWSALGEERAVCNLLAINREQREILLAQTKNRHPPIGFLLI